MSLYFGVFISLFAYLIGMKLKKKFGWPVLNPLLVAIILVIAFLKATGISYTDYNTGASYISYFLTPSTVCLAIPLYKQLELLKKNLTAVAAAIAWLFYRSWYGMVLVIPVNYLIVSYYKNKKRDERAKKLMIEFRDAIQAVAAALLAGYSIEHAWKEAEREIMDLYGKEAMITKELIQMNAEIKLNRNVEEILHDLAVRSGVEEIQSFAEIFGFAKRSGGDFPQIIRTTAARISAKIEVEREVDTVIAGKKLEGKIMSVMPFFILAYLNLASGEFIDPLYGNLAGVLVMSAALLVFVGAMAINRRISDIRV